MKLSEKAFQVLDALDREEISTQRQLAHHSGISLGQVNYILKSLLEKGLVKVGNFRKNPHKIGYVYLLTPKGIETKSKLAVKFVILKLKQYDNLRKRLSEKLSPLQQDRKIRIIFVGPPVIRDFINSLIREENFKIVLSAHCTKWNELQWIDPESFDIALLCDERSEGLAEIEKSLMIPRKKLLPLW